MPFAEAARVVQLQRLCVEVAGVAGERVQRSLAVIAAAEAVVAVGQPGALSARAAGRGRVAPAV